MWRREEREEEGKKKSRGKEGGESCAPPLLKFLDPPLP